ncbi:MAG: DUF2156 domain-containing protein [Lachnospiraceae bacterium]|nr:DUF2156 domain-containing protein [Lachnospiraceae bacterium]
MELDRMEWKAITLKDREWISEKYRQENRKGCENCFGNNYIWRKVYGVEVTEEEGCLLSRSKGQTGIIYSMPIGNGDKKSAIERLRSESAQRGEIFRMRNILEADRELLLKWFGDSVGFESNRDNFDYIYTVEKLTGLSGRKLHGKRNHIARFKEQNDWHYEPMHSENKKACLEMAYDWKQKNADKWNPDMETEFEVLTQAIELFESLHFQGGVLYVENRIVAFTVGEPLNEDTFVVHFEKAYADIQGAYPMINQQFVQHACQSYTYVNREEDTGAEGLRKAKLSYVPDILLEKSMAVFADE